ncbi:tyrosine recombinase [Candidatus Poriferisodalis sp.]|uniref:tyrosine recombinase n=1 Tax=Candidatus Poriferisodalis sp. TaxID=3101277 RepID=UPI003B02D8F5
MSAALAVEAEEYLGWLSNERGRAPHTIASYRADLSGFAAWLGARGTDLLGAGSAEVAAYLAHLRDDLGRASSTCARVAVSLRGLYRFLVAEDLAQSDPAGALDVPRARAGLPRALRRDQIELLLASPAGDSPVALRDRAMLEVLYGMGLRAGELTALSLGDVDLGERLMRVWGKGGKERVVPVGRHAAAAVGDWLSGAGRGAMTPASWRSRDDAAAMFLSARGRRITRQGLWLVVRRHGERVGLGPDQLTTHVLRHSCATHMLDGGADIRSVQELLGHASISSTQRYTAVSQERLTEVYRQAHPRARY